jgi:hypothetical protein
LGSLVRKSLEKWFFVSMGSKPPSQLVVAQIHDLSTEPVANLTHGLHTIKGF